MLLLHCICQHDGGAFGNLAKLHKKIKRLSFAIYSTQKHQINCRRLTKQKSHLLFKDQAVIVTAVPPVLNIALPPRAEQFLQCYCSTMQSSNHKGCNLKCKKNKKKFLFLVGKLDFFKICIHVHTVSTVYFISIMSSRVHFLRSPVQMFTDDCIVKFENLEWQRSRFVCGIVVIWPTDFCLWHTCLVYACKVVVVNAWASFHAKSPHPQKLFFLKHEGLHFMKFILSMGSTKSISECPNVTGIGFGIGAGYKITLVSRQYRITCRSGKFWFQSSNKIVDKKYLPKVQTLVRLFSS